MFKEECHMTFERGRRLRAKQFMTFSVTSVKHKKDKKLFLHVDLTHYFTKAIKRVFIPLLLFVVQSSIQLQQKETETNSYLHFQQSTCLTFLSWHVQLNLIPTEICIIISQICAYSTQNTIINAMVIQTI